MGLHVNIEYLLSARTVESDRIEYKKGWNPDSIYRSICAFANDFDNTGGGYIIIGVEEDSFSKTAHRPVAGLSTDQLSDIQRKMIGFNNLLQPAYHPKFSIEEVDEKQIAVLWIPGGTNRPYTVPEQVTASVKRSFYYIRKYANSVKANLEEQQELISIANQVPFDDRANTLTGIENISIVLIKNYLLKVKSKLATQIGKISELELLAQMELVSGPNEHVFPRNVGLIMFSENPEKYFPYTQVEMVFFPNGEDMEFTEYPIITGPVPEQIRLTLDFLKTHFLKEQVIKQKDQAESIRIWNYPLQAIEEILVNAFYHRDYQVREPIEIRIYPNSIVFLNYGGPDRSIPIQALISGKARARRYRNRRLGEFLKELGLTEGRATGIPTTLKVLNENGSPPANFTTDEERTYFEVEIFCHPSFKQKRDLKLPLEGVFLNLESIDSILNKLLEYYYPGEFIDNTGNLVDTHVHNDVSFIKSLDIQAFELILQLKKSVAGNQVSTLAGIIATVVTPKEIEVLQTCRNATAREIILTRLGVTNQRKNFARFMLPMVKLRWLSMTIIEKPTSPKQQYFSTIKGRLVLELVKYYQNQ